MSRKILVHILIVSATLLSYSNAMARQIVAGPEGEGPKLIREIGATEKVQLSEFYRQCMATACNDNPQTCSTYGTQSSCEAMTKDAVTRGVTSATFVPPVVSCGVGFLNDVAVGKCIGMCIEGYKLGLDEKCSLIETKQADKYFRALTKEEQPRFDRCSTLKCNNVGRYESPERKACWNSCVKEAIDASGVTDSNKEPIAEVKIETKTEEDEFKLSEPSSLEDSLEIEKSVRSNINLRIADIEERLRKSRTAYDSRLKALRDAESRIRFFSSNIIETPFEKLKSLDAQIYYFKGKDEFRVKELREESDKLKNSIFASEGGVEFLRQYKTIYEDIYVTMGPKNIGHTLNGSIQKDEDLLKSAIGLRDSSEERTKKIEAEIEYRNSSGFRRFGRWFKRTFWR
jgi:hypothetical protein